MTTRKDYFEKAVIILNKDIISADEKEEIRSFIEGYYGKLEGIEYLSNRALLNLSSLIPKKYRLR